MLTAPALRKSGRFVWVWLLLLMVLMPSAAPASPPSILILHPYRRDAMPFGAVSAELKIALSRNISAPLDIYEESLDLDRFPSSPAQSGMAEFLKKRFSAHRIDLVVPIGAPAAQFLVQYRESVFPGTPALFLSADSRLIDPKSLRRNGTVINQRFSTTDWVEDILQIAPDTTNIAIVMGISPSEKAWSDIMRRDFSVYRGRVNFQFLTGMSLDETEKRISAMPPHSFILLGMLIKDAAGITFDRHAPIERLHQVANAPLYGVFQSQLGRGIVGGRLFQDQTMGSLAANAAARILRGEPAESIPEHMIPTASPVYDWRELKRWGISEARLPPGSTVLFREQTLWHRYRWYIATFAVFALIQTLLIIGLLKNLARRRRVERSLRQSEQKYRRLYESMMDGFVSVDMSGLIQEFNPAYQKMLGYPEEELRRLTYVEITPGKWHELESRILREQILPRGFSDVYEKEYRRKDGTVFPVELRTLMTRDETGEPCGMWAIVRDITERKGADEALRESETRFRHVTETVSDFIWEVDADGLYTYTSPSVERILGYTPDELIGKMHFHDLFAPDVREQLREEALRVFAARQNFHALPNSNISKTGKIVHLETSGMPILDEAGRLLGYRGADTDVTDKRQAELETRRIREELTHFLRVATLGELTASIAHEINQPLAAILGNAQAALNYVESGTPDLKELREILTDIVADNRRAADVIRSLRSMIKRSTGEHQPLLLNDLIHDVLSIVRSDALTRQIPVVLDLGSPLPSVGGDRVQLQQVILNLIINAFEAIDSSGQPATLRIRTREAEGEVVLSVVDSGHGIAAGKSDTIFEPFVTTKKEGLGMGLALSRTIVTAHNGRLWAENNPGGGATFHMALPPLKS